MTPQNIEKKPIRRSK